MRIRILSDLHHEHFGGLRDLPDVPADVVVLAGDIHTHENGIAWAAQKFGGTPVIYVPGNHEFYHSHMQKLQARMRRTAKKHGVHLLQDEAVEIDGVRFLGATLWTDFDLYGAPGDELAQAAGLRVMPDFRCIDTLQGTFTPEHSIALHCQSRDWLHAALRQSFDGKTVVVTHHAPSEKSVPRQFKGDRLSPAFSSNLDALVALTDLWIHGHTHTCFDYRIGNGRVVANPGGYPGENAEFNPMLVVEI
jgi:predicted phosphodiesterase